MPVGVRTLANTIKNYENITPGDTATGISASKLENGGLTAKEIFVTCEDQTVHWAVHANPTAAAGTNVGSQLTAGSSITIEGIENIKNFKVIDAVSGSAGTIKVHIMF